MLIGKLAEHAGVTARMVRYYANAGLVRSTRDANGYRDFDATQVIRVRQIQALLGLGLTIRQITDLLPCLGSDPEAPSCPAARKAIRQRLHTIDAQIAALTTLRERIVDALDLAATALPGTALLGISAGVGGVGHQPAGEVLGAFLAATI